MMLTNNNFKELNRFLSINIKQNRLKINYKKIKYKHNYDFLMIL